MFAQNVQLQLLFTHRSGSLYDDPSTRPATGNRLMTLMLSAGF